MLPIMMAFLLLIDRAPVQPLPEVIAIMKISECHLLAGKGRAA